MYSQMTRFAFGLKCGGLTTPWTPGAFAFSAARTDGSSREARASEPRPAPLRPRKARRGARGGKGALRGPSPPHGLVRGEHGPADARPHGPLAAPSGPVH